MAKSIHSAPTPAALPPDIAAKLDKPVTMGGGGGSTAAAVAEPPVEVPLSVPSSGKSALAYTDDEISAIAVNDPLKAQAILDIQDRLRKRTVDNARAEQEAASKLMTMKAIEKEMHEAVAIQQSCEMRGHPDEFMRKVNICGQFLASTNEFFGVCLTCLKTFNGIGLEEGQLHPDLARRVKWDDVGRG